MFNVVSINDVKIKIGQVCKQERLFHNLTQEQLAVELALSRITIQKLEKGKNVTLDTFLKVFNHFDRLEALNEYLNVMIENLEVKSLY